MTAKKKIQLTRRSSREIALRKGFELPAREGKGVIGFEDMDAFIDRSTARIYPHFIYAFC